MLLRSSKYNASAVARAIQLLFEGSKQGAHFEAYDPTKLAQRRNLLTYSNVYSVWNDNVTNGDWNYSYGVAPDGSITTLAKSPGTRYRSVSGGIPGQNYVYSFFARKVPGYSLVRIYADGAGLALSQGANYNFDTDAWSNLTGNPVYGRELLEGGVVRLWLQLTPISAANISCHVLGLSTIGTEVWNSQVDKGTTPTIYQNVTDWNTEYMAAAPNSINMWQDATATTPVTAVEQPVGFWRDTKFGAAINPELVPDSDFDGDTILWGKQDGNENIVMLGDGEMRVDFNGASNYVRLTIPVTPNVWHEFIADYRLGPNITGAWLSVRATDDAGAVVAQTVGTPTINGVTRTLFLPTTTTVGIRLGVICTAPATIYWKRASVKATPGNHATQATPISRPMLSARYNLLTKTEQFDDSAWVKAGASVVRSDTVFAPDGTATAWLLTENSATGAHYLLQTVAVGASKVGLYLKSNGRRYVNVRGESPQHSVAVRFDLSGIGAVNIVTGAGTIAALSDGWYFCTVSVPSGTGDSGYFVIEAMSPDGSTNSFTGDGVSGYYIWHPDVRTAADAALNIPAYQRVNTPTDYDTEDFPHYLKFDGVDDGLQTGNIDFTSTDKMTVWAGVTKLSDAAVGIAVELTASAATNTGAFYLAGPGSPSTAIWTAASRGISAAIATASAAAPNSDVLTLLSDIGGDSLQLRRNGTSGPPTTSDQGAGTYSNAPIYIGARGGGGLYLNGRIYSLTPRGATSSSGEIRRTERYIAERMGKVLA